MTEDNKTSYPSSIRMLTSESSPVELYQELCKVIEELEEYKNKAYNYEQGYHIQTLRADEAENKIADHQIRQYSPYDHTKDTFLTFQEPPKTGWDLYITPEFTLNNIKPVNWFNRKMQELILGFKWKRQ